MEATNCETANRRLSDVSRYRAESFSFNVASVGYAAYNFGCNGLYCLVNLYRWHFCGKKHEPTNIDHKDNRKTDIRVNRCYEINLRIIHKTNRPFNESSPSNFPLASLLSTTEKRKRKWIFRCFEWTCFRMDINPVAKSVCNMRLLSTDVARIEPQTLQRRGILRERKAAAFLRSISLLFFASVSRASSVGCAKKKGRKEERKEERKKERKRKSRRSSPSSKAEEAFHAGLRIQSGRIIRSPFTGIYFFSLFSPPSPRFSSFLSRFVDRTIGSCAECCCLRIVLAEKFPLKNPQRRNRKNVRGKVMLRSSSVRTSYANFRDLYRSLSKTLREKPERTDRNAIPFPKSLATTRSMYPW